ncbi:MAG: DUF192 domain-containing protein [Candidatus Omnitrophota bacterium]|jgi:hypothetical protein
MMRKYLFAGVVILLFCSSCSSASSPQVCIGKACVSVELADTDALRAQGLMFRESLPGDRGMLFVFEKENLHSFWMKNTRIPLDMIWIGADKRVVSIRERVQPCVTPVCRTYSPGVKALYVLEVNAGFVDTYGIQIGDQVGF